MFAKAFLATLGVICAFCAVYVCWVVVGFIVDKCYELYLTIRERVGKKDG